MARCSQTIGCLIQTINQPKHSKAVKGDVMNDKWTKLILLTVGAIAEWLCPDNQEEE